MFPLTNKEEYAALEKHWSLLYDLMVDCKYVPQAICETVDGIKRSYTGSTDPFDNAILSCTQAGKSLDQRIVEQLDYFNS